MAVSATQITALTPMGVMGQVYSFSAKEEGIIICPTPLTLASASSLSSLTVKGVGSLDPLTTASPEALTALPTKLPCVP